MPTPAHPYHAAHAVLVCVGVLCQATGAQEAPVAQVEIKGQYDERREDTASKTVISRDELDRFGDTTLLGVLKRLPAVTVAGNEVRMRGLGGGYTQILINGQRAPSGFAIESLTPDAIEKIEILRSATAELGTQGIAGTLNLITRSVRHTGNTRREAKVSIGDEGRRITPYATLSQSGRDGPLSHTLVLSLSQSRFDTPSTIEERHVATSSSAGLAAIDSRMRTVGGSDSIFFTPRLNWKLANGDSLNSQSLLRFVRNDADTQETATTLLGVAPAYARSTARSESATQVVNTNLHWVRRIDERNLLDTKLGVTHTRRKHDTRFIGSGSPLLAPLDRRTALDASDAELTFSGKNVSSVLPGHSLVAGWDAAHWRRDEGRQQSDAPDADFSVRVNRLALFAQDEWSVAPRWSVYLGARWEAISTDSADGTDDAAKGSHSRSDSRSRSAVWSPIAHALWKLPGSEGTQLRLALARTYKAPAVGSLNARQVLANVNTRSTPDYRGNPRLRPALAWGLDLTYEYFAAEGAMFSASGYLRRISDVTGQSVREIGGRWVVMPDNLGHASSSGIALEAQANLQQWFEAAPALELRASVNRNWSQVEGIPGPGNRLAGQTPSSLNLGVDYSAPRSHLTTGASFNLQTGGLVRNSASESISTGVVRNLDVYGVWKFDKHRRLRLALSNLLHQDSVSVSRVLDDAGGMTRSQRERNFASARLTYEHALR